MKRYPHNPTVGVIVTSLVLLLMLWSAPLLGSFQLERLALESNGKTTLALIETDGVVSYNHFKLEDDLFRVVVDLQETLNPAGLGEYAELPGASLTSIRTSQFSEDPLVTRIVFDFEKALEYRAEQQGETIKLLFSTPGEEVFPDTTVFQAERRLPQKSQGRVVGLTPLTTVEGGEEPGRKDPPAPAQKIESEKAASPQEDQFQLKGISIEGQADTILAVIRTDGVVPFRHFTLEGQKFLVAVDLKRTRNPLGLASYGELPSTKLISIRTSQFSYEPLVSRVVFGFPQELEYRVRQKGQQIKLSFSTPGEKPFSSFSLFPPESKLVRESPPKELVVAQAKTSESVERSANPAPQSGAGKNMILPERDKVQYNPRNPRDPFAPLIGKQNPKGLVASDLPRGESLKLVGIVNEGSQFKALCEDQHGLGYILGEGDPLKDGYVASVQADQVVFVIEQYGWSHRQVLTLPSFGQ